jgi:hypothetical protein
MWFILLGTHHKLKYFIAVHSVRCSDLHPTIA